MVFYFSMKWSTLFCVLSIMVSLFYSINHSLISCNCKSFLFLSSPLVVLKRCLEKFFVHILRLLAGKLGKICTAVSLASFRQKNLTKYYVKFPAKRYSYIISKKNLVVIFLSWYLHQFCQILPSILDWDLLHESIFRSLKRKSIMQGKGTD